MAPQLDHVVILVPYHDLVNSPDWITKNFTVSPGGRHADNKTENRLVILSDNIYIELIAFIDDDPKRREGHWWAKPFGVVDFALTTKNEFDYDGLQARLKKSGCGISYAKPQAGGRITPPPDSKELKWKVTFPEHVKRGAVPFWCHDVTPREWRVPVSDQSTTHPCGVTGVASVEVALEDGEVKGICRALRAITEAPEDPSSDVDFAIGTPRNVDGPKPVISVTGSPDDGSVPLRLTLTLRCPKGKRPDNIRQDTGRGVIEIKFED